ncbi:hypothetical protein G5714_005222 [Onychostoma macrolepis]|uniref:Dolichyl-diphosphooligosaccharide--protein glycosyltransferase subunit 4 n=1 Tax=Onychostoma macrolepis TaxID=369639 RepID=A0A7J6D6U8_9TELE|nr:hypothetical protein G5714_005222 [Onychostoma macrolepis]
MSDLAPVGGLARRESHQRLQRSGGQTRLPLQVTCLNPGTHRSSSVSSRFLINITKTTQSAEMVTDVQLAIFANMLGVSLFLLVVLYHYVAVNNPKKLE